VNYSNLNSRNVVVTRMDVVVRAINVVAVIKNDLWLINIRFERMI